MLIRVKKSVGIAFILGLSLLVGLFMFNRQQGIFMGESMTAPPVTITPTEAPPAPVDAKSIDGLMKIIMRTTPKEDGMASYSFFIFDGEKEYSIFMRDAKKHAFVVPSNSWSPDGSYVFLIDTTSLPEQILVFKASGEAFADGKAFLDVTQLFAENNKQHILDTATGWDSRGLLHIKTKNQDGTKSASYWFDVYSRSFIQLAAR